jgi:hypothetical protein
LYAERVAPRCCAVVRELLLDNAGTPSSGSPPVDTFAFLHSLFWLCANLARRTPAILVIDDCHWIDGESLRWLRFPDGCLSQVLPAVTHPPCLRLPQPRSADRHGQPHPVAASALHFRTIMERSTEMSGEPIEW